MRQFGSFGIALATLLSGMPAMLSAAPPQAPSAATVAPEGAAQRALYEAMPDTAGTGPFPAIKIVDSSFPGYVVYRPRDLAALGDMKLAVLAWGNGGCSADGASARLELAEIASHGYLVLAPGTVRSGPGSPPHAPEAMPHGGSPLPSETKPAALIHAIDLAVAAAARGPYAGLINPKQIAVAGHSCGGLQAIAAAADPRVKTVIIQNSGTFPDGQHPIIGMDVPKAALHSIHTPIIYLLGGATDIAHDNGMDDFSRIERVPVMVANSEVGHSGSFYQPNGGHVATVATAWLQWQLRGDAEAAKDFVGADCRLCSDGTWKIERRNF